MAPATNGVTGHTPMWHDQQERRQMDRWTDTGNCTVGYLSPNTITTTADLHMPGKQTSASEPRETFKVMMLTDRSGILKSAKMESSSVMGWLSTLVKDSWLILSQSDSRYSATHPPNQTLSINCKPDAITDTWLHPLSWTSHLANINH